MAHSTMKFNWIKPLKRSQKARLRKELEKRKKNEQMELRETNGWKSCNLPFGGKSRVTKDGWEFKL